MDIILAVMMMDMKIIAVLIIDDHCEGNTTQQYHVKLTLT